jgi:hypothetical protein
MLRKDALDLLAEHKRIYNTMCLSFEHDNLNSNYENYSLDPSTRYLEIRSESTNVRDRCTRFAKNYLFSKNASHSDSDDSSEANEGNYSSDDSSSS